MPTAIVTGATGLLGREIVFALGHDSRWTKIHALSHSKSDKYPDSVQQDKIDLTAKAEDIAKQLKEQNVEGEYLFFAAYLAKEDEQEASDVNGAMLSNFLQALKINSVDKKLKRVILTTGAKHYGVHLGPVKTPMVESDPWVEGSSFPTNFYYTQQRILHSSSASSNWDWVVTYPNDVIGVARGNFMNLVTSIAIYAAINRELSGELNFPGSEKTYSLYDYFTSAKLHAQFNLWVAEKKEASNQAFNVVNGDAETWANLWPQVAKKFGCTVPERMFEREAEIPMSNELNSISPYAAEQATQAGLDGKIERGMLEGRVNLVEWAKKPEVKSAWEKIAKKNGFEEDAFEKATWDFLSFVLGRNYNLVISMSKARKMGWTGYVDTWESLEEAFDRLKEEKIVA